jgi:hypothetical protein
MGLCPDKRALEYDISFLGPGSSYRRSALTLLHLAVGTLGAEPIFGVDRIVNRDRPNGSGSV